MQSIGICFAFWLINVCDEWDIDSSSDNIEVNGQTAKWLKSIDGSMYGCHGVDKGSYSWTITFKKDIEWACIGVIEDDPEVLKRFQHSYDYDEQSHGCFLFSYGDFYHDDDYDQYCDMFQRKDTTITMTLNMDEHSLAYTIDGKDHGIATNTLQKCKNFSSQRQQKVLQNKEYLVDCNKARININLEARANFICIYRKSRYLKVQLLVCYHNNLTSWFSVSNVITILYRSLSNLFVATP